MKRRRRGRLSLPVQAWVPLGPKPTLEGRIKQAILRIGYLPAEPEWGKTTLTDGSPLGDPAPWSVIEAQVWVEAAAQVIPGA